MFLWSGGRFTFSLQVNTNGALVLFQAAYPLLKESKTPKFVAVSSVIGSITMAAQLPVNVYPYGASKAAINWIMRKLHHDFPDFGWSHVASSLVWVSDRCHSDIPHQPWCRRDGHGKDEP